MENQDLVWIFFIIILLVSVLTFIAIKLLPKVDKSFDLKVPRLINHDCTLENAVSALKLVNPMEKVYENGNR